MTITIELTSGVGIHATYTVTADGRPVAKITRRSSHDMWRIRSVYYSEELAKGGMTIATAKQVANTLSYPSATEVYEKVCERIEGNRKKQMEHYHHNDFVRLSRAIVDGSNSAHAELAALVAKIDAFAIDREDTRKRWRETGGDHGPHGTTTRGRNFDFYPEPPEPPQ